MSSTEARLETLELQLAGLRRRQWLFGIVAAGAIAVACKDNPEPITKVVIGNVVLDANGLVIGNGDHKVAVTINGIDVADGAQHASYQAARLTLASPAASATVSTLLDTPRVELAGAHFFAVVQADASSARVALGPGQANKPTADRKLGPNATMLVEGGEAPLAFVTINAAATEATMTATDAKANVAATINGIATNLVGGK